MYEAFHTYLFVLCCILGGVAAFLVLAWFSWRRSKKTGDKRFIPWAYRVLGLCVAVAIYTVVSYGSAQASMVWPGGGTRNTDEWYYCHSAWIVGSSLTTAGTFDTWTCDHILWSEEGGNPGEYDSQNMVGVIAATTGPFNALVRGYVVPPAGIYRFDYACDASISYIRGAACTSGSCSSGGFYKGGFNSMLSGTSSQLLVDNTLMALAPPTVPIAGASNTVNLDAVGWVRSSSGTTDYLLSWSNSLVSALSSNSNAVFASNLNYQLVAGTAWDNSQAGASFSCQIIDYSALAGTDPWVPGPGDLEPIATATPGPTPTGIFWDSEPWVPITSTVNAPFFEVTPPEGSTCYTIIPEITLGDDTSTGVEFCISDWTISLRLMGYDVGGALLICFSLAAAGVLFSILKSGG